MPHQTQFWNKIAEKYAALPISDPQNYERKLEATRKVMRSDMKVLEFGCGTGGTAIKLAPYVDSYQVTDLSPRMIEIARAKEGGADMRFEVADFDNMPLDDRAFDAIIGHSILHVLPNPNTTIEKVYAALKPGGFFISSTACLGKIWYLKLIAPIGQVLGKLPDLSYFSDVQLKEMLGNAGFNIVESWQPNKKSALFIIAQKPA